MTRIETVVEACQQLLPNDRLDEFLALVGELTPVEEEKEGAITYLFLPEVSVLLTPRGDGTLKSVTYEEGFPGEINGIRIGMTGDEVEAKLGPVDRLWPMPHPDYVLIWDSPHFFRVDLDRETEQVKKMYR
ncbi:hypothetical protein [Vannielia litorea]|uniref:Uncharacterized protein n=1 Tax=Vannielia litorea TaxID=1217970 RepID=A0A1N6ID47_9RHOB|nr:hypothetical protein [Vannielia litorea]SIO29891.1 hypothetical protein SAMN05444002_3718 [Vannielia litorea]